jgi:hypothetical protein
MNRPRLYETIYAHDRREHRHRCQCCHRIITAGEAVLMWRVSSKVSRALHLTCADKVSNDGLTCRQLAQLHSDLYAKGLGYR